MLVSDNMKKKLTSRKFWFTIIGILLPVLNEELGWGLSKDAVVSIITVIGMFLGVEGLADIVGRYKGQQ